jgi:hypothetical protein
MTLNRQMPVIAGRKRVLRRGRPELRGFEPRIEPAKIGSELHFPSLRVVTQLLRVLRIYIGVLRDVIVLGIQVAASAAQESAPESPLSPGLIAHRRSHSLVLSTRTESAGRTGHWPRRCRRIRRR